MLLLAFVFLLQSAAGNFNEGNRLFAAGKFPEALAAYDQAAAAEPNRADIHLGRCRTLAAMREFDQALKACDRSLELQPSNADALRDRGHYKLNLGRTDDAERDLERAEALNAKDRNIYYHLGLVHYFKGEFRESAQQFQGCLKNSKEKADQIECDAWLYPALVRGGEKAEAQNLLDGIAPDPSITGHPAWYFNRLLLFKGLMTEEQVAANLNAEGALSLESVGYSIGLWHLLNGRESKAREYYQKVLSGDLPFAWGYRAAQADLKQMDHSPVTAALPLAGYPCTGRHGCDAPQVIQQPICDYTDEARKAGINGTVAVQFVVRSDGKVQDVSVTRPLGKGLDEAVLQCVRQLTFRPAKKNGNAVPVLVTFNYGFHM